MKIRVKKGEHKFFPINNFLSKIDIRNYIQFNFKNYISCVFCFSSKSRYNQDTKQLKNQYNKLFGATSSLIARKNSAMIAFRYNENNRIELSAYVHNSKKEVKTHHICFIEENETYYGEIFNHGYYYEFIIRSLNRIWRVTVLKDTLNNKFIFKLFPWFGGKAKAPNDIELYFRFNN